MLTTYLKTPSALVRYRSSPAGPHLDAFVDWLESQGYRPKPIRHLLRGVDRFAHWASQAGLSAQELDAQALETFRQPLHDQQRRRYPSGSFTHPFVGARPFAQFHAVTGHAGAAA